MNNAADESRTVVVTGASDGIGAAAARILARRGDRVIVVGRSPTKTHAIAAEIGAECHVADFAHLDQVRGLAAELRARHPGIDVLLNNAGLIADARRTVTADGRELTFQVNHLAPFLLTVLLKDALATAQGRVVTTSSQASTARGAQVVIDDLDMANGYDGLRAYQASKLANVLFTRELARRWGPLGVSSAAAHPGLVRSQWGRSGPIAVRLVVNSPLRLAMRSPERGADTLVWLSTSVPGKDWQSGGYFADRKPAAAKPDADDRALAAELWNRSALMCGLQPSDAALPKPTGRLHQMQQAKPQQRPGGVQASGRTPPELGNLRLGSSFYWRSALIRRVQYSWPAHRRVVTLRSRSGSGAYRASRGRLSGGTADIRHA